jgi:Ser/Thr protein kinase RdoA (MazF antagonist)
MSPASLDLTAWSVLQHYSGVLNARSLTSLGNRGGFSGARLWRIRCDLGDLCLRAWPPGTTAEALAFQHGAMQRARQAGLTFVPFVYPSADAKTWVEHEGHFWEVTSWQPGKADFEANPSAERLRNACAALARLHDAWTPSSECEGKCPAIQRRLTRTEEWLQLTASGWRAPLAARPEDPLRSLVERAWFVLAEHAPRVPPQLAPFESVKVPLQPCLCDVWHDHLLFEGDTLTGLVDFGGVKIDHVSVDLARMLGSLVADDADLWSVGLEAYRGVRDLSAEEEALARGLDTTGTIVGLVNWLLWIYCDRREFDDLPAVARRIKILVNRIERCR